MPRGGCQGGAHPEKGRGEAQGVGGQNVIGDGDSWGRETERDKEMDTEKGRDGERDKRRDTERH